MKAILATMFFLATGCVIGDSSEEANQDDVDASSDAVDIDPSQPQSAELRPLVAGVNGSACIASPYNCKFRAAGGNRVTTAAGSESWAIETGDAIVDGNGTVLGTQTGGSMTFNYGQTRRFGGRLHALALSTSNHSAGWYPIERIKGEASFRARNGDVNGKDPGVAKMACYKVRNSHDASIELKKVVYDSQVGEAGHERVGDYLPLVRGNGVRSVNLVLSVPGFGLGGATTDHFPAGSLFQRVSVPTTSGRPSITIPTWVAASNGAFTKRSGQLRFFYGYIRGANDERRFGWLAEEAITPATGCP